MAKANTQLEVSDLDFQNIKDSLKNYLKKQSEFSDFDFEGSNLNILLDILAYNTHYNTYYLNMIANEMFLESAQLRNNVVSRAKGLGYRPRSARGATAKIKLTVTPSDSSVSTVRVPKNTEFTSSVDGTNLTFVTPTSYNLTKNANNNFVKTVDIVEGLPLTHRYTYTSTNKKFIIPNENVDIRSIRVKVEESATDKTNTAFSIANNLTEVTRDSNVFFLEEELNGQYEISFGDDVLGKSPKINNIIAVDYRVCNDDEGNGIDSFSFSDDNIDGHSNVTFNVVESATGGVKKEDIESVKFNAPKNYETQNRAVTESDYRNIVLRDNSDIQALKVWGGEENDPPLYGKVILAIKPKDLTTLYENRKDEIVTQLQKYNLVSIKPEIVDPSYLYIVPNVNVGYDSRETNKTVGDIANVVANRIKEFEKNQLGIFDSKFKYSRFISKIDNSDESITYNLTDIRMQKRFVPSVNNNATYKITFNNKIARPESSNHPLHDGSHNITSTKFTYNNQKGAMLDDDGEGTIRVFYMNTKGKRIYLERNAGSVNYETGLVTLPSMIIQDYEGAELKIYANPRSNNIKSVRAQILLIDDSVINVTDDNNEKVTTTLTNISTSGSFTTTNDNGIKVVTF